MLPGDSTGARKGRGAFFTPPSIAQHLASWAIDGKSEALVLDPTCGEAVFLDAAAQTLNALGLPADELGRQLFGIDLHDASVVEAAEVLARRGVRANLITSDFFAVPSPGGSLDTPIPLVDAVVGNPPFVRFQEHTGASRSLSVGAALSQGVRLSGLASSWAASLIHAASFLKPDGRIAMVLPAEVLTVGYAEPVREWLRNRFERVSLVLFEKLQFQDALADVVLLLAEGQGGCDSFSLYHVASAAELETHIKPYNHTNVTPPDSGKWTDLLIPKKSRVLYKSVVANSFVTLRDYGRLELGAVSGANTFFAITEATRTKFGLRMDQVEPISPPGTKHFKSSSFSKDDWEMLKDSNERVWLFRPSGDDDSESRLLYTQYGESLSAHESYKSRKRTPWWRPPIVAPPELFFTYMSHNYPRLINNEAGVSFLNSMHGVHLMAGAHSWLREALPLLAINSVTLIGAEINGRSYGGGVLKMEPSEAALLPLPRLDILETAWQRVSSLRTDMDGFLAAGEWTKVTGLVDEAVLGAGLGLDAETTEMLQKSATALRARRLNRA